MVLALLLKFILQIFVYYKAFKRLRIKNLFIFAPILEIYQMILNFFLELRIATTKKSKWR
jgi:hypothetical protein